MCGESVAQHNLVKHFIFEHDYDPMDAGEAAGLVMRKSWSKERRIELLQGVTGNSAIGWDFRITLKFATYLNQFVARLMYD